MSFDRDISPTGLVTDIGFEDGKMKVRYMQRTQEAHELNKAMRESDEFTKTGIKKDLWKVVSLTEADCLRMMVEDGIDPYKVTARELRNHLMRHRDKWGHVFTTRGNF